MQQCFIFMDELRNDNQLMDKQDRDQCNLFKEEVARQKLIQWSDKQYTRKDSSENFNFNIESSYRSNESKLPKTIRITQSGKNKPGIKVSHKYDSIDLAIEEEELRKRSSTQRSPMQRSPIERRVKSFDGKQVIVKAPVSISNYLVAGRTRFFQSFSAPKSEYIIRQIRNTRKLQRQKQKTQATARPACIDKIITEREKDKGVSKQRVLITSRHQFASFLQEKRR